MFRFKRSQQRSLDMTLTALQQRNFAEGCAIFIEHYRRLAQQRPLTQDELNEVDDDLTTLHRYVMARFEDGHSEVAVKLSSWLDYHREWYVEILLSRIARLQPA